MSSVTPAAPAESSTLRALARLLPFVRPVLRPLLLGAVSALAASVVALMIPLALEGVVAGPISSADPAQIALGTAAVIALGFA